MADYRMHACNRGGCTAWSRDSAEPLLMYACVVHRSPKDGSDCDENPNETSYPADQADPTNPDPPSAYPIEVCNAYVGYDALILTLQSCLKILLSDVCSACGKTR